MLVSNQLLVLSSHMPPHIVELPYEWLDKRLLECKRRGNGEGEQEKGDHKWNPQSPAPAVSADHEGMSWPGPPPMSLV